MLVKGFEFNPSGEDLINFYLYPWVRQEKLPWNGIPVKEIYGPSSDPWVVFYDVESRWHSRLEEKGAIKYSIYAFSFISRVSNSKRVSRRAGTGTWDGQTGPKIIQDSKNGQIIGQSKMLAFQRPGSEADFGHWTMHEYSLSDDLIRSSGVPNAADVVVCKITKTVNKKKSGGTRASHPLAETNELKNDYGNVVDPIPLQLFSETNELTSCSQPEDAYSGVFDDLTPLLSSSETNKLIRDLQAENSYRTSSDIPAAQQPMADTDELTWRSLVENGDFDISGVHEQSHGNGSDSVWVWPPQITHHEAVRDGSSDPSYYPTDISDPVGPVASKKRAAEVHHPNEEDIEGVLKRQKISCDEDSSYTAMPEPDLMDNDDEDEEEEEEEPAFATKLAHLLLAINGMKPS